LCLTSEMNDEVSNDAQRQQLQQDDQHQTKTVQITLQSGVTSHKKRYFTFTEIHPFTYKFKSGNSGPHDCLLCSLVVTLTIMLCLNGYQHRPRFKFQVC